MPKESAPTPDELLAAAGDLDALTDDELVALSEQLRAAAETVADGDGDVLETLRAIRTAVEAIDTTLNERAAAAATRQAEIDAELAGIRGEAEGDDETENGDADDAGDATDTDVDGAADDEGDGASDADGEDGDASDGADADTTDERIAASAVTRVRHRTGATTAAATAMRQRRAPRPTPPAPAHQMALRASANVPDMPAGELLDTEEKVANAFGAAIRAAASYRGPRIELPVATIGGDPHELFGDDRYLDDSARRNDTKIKALTSGKALRASGGACAPRPVRYDSPIVGVEDRPVRDAYANFGADRAGIRLIPPPVFTDVDDGVSQWTNANDITPAAPTTKPCVTMTCPSDVETLVYAVTQCMKVGNFRQRFFPEQVDEWVRLSAIWTARYAETLLLTQQGTLSKNVTLGGDAATDLGTTRQVLRGLDRAAAALRNRHRLAPDFPLRFIAPAWLLDNIMADLAAEAPGSQAERLATSDAEIGTFFAARQINLTLTLDGETGQIFGAQSDGALVGWPSHAVGYLFIEGEFLHLDGGQINLGIVRDSTLVGTNDFIMFSEFFENVAFHGTEAMRIDFDICPDGRTSAPVAFAPCTTGS